MHCCEAWEPVGKCFDQCSFECIDFHGLTQIIASLTRERIADREAEIRDLPWTQTEKGNALAKCRFGLRAWRTKKLMLCLHAVTDEENEDESGRRLREHWRTVFEARVQKGPDDVGEFDELLATKKQSAPGPDGIPYSFCGCAGGLGSQFLYSAHKHVIEGGPVPALFAASRTVIISKSSDVDNNGRIVRSPEALRPLTLCNCDCKILTTAICRGLHWYTMRCIHPSQRCISARQMTTTSSKLKRLPWPMWRALHKNQVFS